MNDFLLLSLLFLVPGALAYGLRKDLRGTIHLAALASLPFAATERFFAGSYWSPPSLFGLIDILGFGIEDVLFVVALAAYISTGYALVFRKSLEPRKEPSPRPLVLGLTAVFGTLGLALALVLLRVHILYGAFVAMGACGLLVMVRRPDLAAPGILGGLLAASTYALICVVFAYLRPGVFLRVWHTERFIHRFAFGVPIEELLYGFLAGVVGSVFYPYVTNSRYRTR